MELSPSNGVVLGAAIAAGWGFACAVYERLILAPRHRWSALGPSYFPAMIFATPTALMVLIADDRVRPFFALLMALIAFAVGAAPAFAAFHFSRWLFRTRFSDEKTN